MQGGRFRGACKDNIFQLTVERQQVRAQEIQVANAGCDRACPESMIQSLVTDARCKVKAKEADAVGRAYTACSIGGGRCRVEAKEADAVERAQIAYPVNGGRCKVEDEETDAVERVPR